MSNEQVLADWIVGARDEELIAGIIVMADSLRERTGVTFTWPQVAEGSHRLGDFTVDESGVKVYATETAEVPWSAPDDEMPVRGVTEEMLLADEDFKDALTLLAKEWSADNPDDSYQMGWVAVDAVSEWLRAGHYPSGAEVSNETADALNEYALQGYNAEAVGRRVLTLATA